jgi:hypothetical protein
MALMLAYIFLCVAIGLFAQRFGARDNLTIALLAVLMAALYLAVERLM